MFRAVIVDDESKARNALKNLLEKNCSNIAVLAEGDCVQAGVELIRKHQPDVVFLDVQMPDGTGFDLLEQLGEINFKIIFASAYDKFAIQAFKFSAVDYLQKPVEANELIEACSRISGDDKYLDINKKLEVLLGNRNSFEKIALPTLEGIDFVKIKEIVHCESDNNYTNIFLANGQKIVVSKTLKEYDEMLSPFNFFRIHKSSLINLSFLKKYRKGDGGTVVMEDGVELEVSRRRKEDFLNALKSC
jgi:two-component system LytT family response regulator